MDRSRTSWCVSIRPASWRSSKPRRGGIVVPASPPARRRLVECHFDSKTPLKEKAHESWAFEIDWCGRGDSNPHALRRHPLKMVRLPVPPLPHGVRCKFCTAGHSNAVALCPSGPPDYFVGAGAAGAVGAGADAGAVGAGTAGGAVLDGLENCCSTELPVETAVVF